MTKVFIDKNTLMKTLPIVTLTVIILGSFGPNIAFALTADEEILAGQNFATNSIREPAPQQFHLKTGENVALELQLLVDVSGSVDATEYAYQQDGYAAAFRNITNDPLNPGVIDKIKNAKNCIAVQYVHWSGASQQAIKIDWTKLCTQADSEAFANQIDGLSRSFSGSTAPGSAINFGVTQFGSDYIGKRKVIDVSGDGIQNSGADTPTARDNALTTIDTINGISIGNAGGVNAWYPANIVGGDDAIARSATSFAQFVPAVLDKILYELDDPEQPRTVAGESLDINMTSLMVAGLFGNALWITPVAAAALGTGLYLARSKIK